MTIIYILQTIAVRLLVCIWQFLAKKSFWWSHAVRLLHAEFLFRYTSKWRSVEYSNSFHPYRLHDVPNRFGIKYFANSFSTQTVFYYWLFWARSRCVSNLLAIFTSNFVYFEISTLDWGYSWSVQNEGTTSGTLSLKAVKQRVASYDETRQAGFL